LKKKLDKKIAFIGSGAMAEPMISGLLRHKLARPENLRASDTRIERVEELHKKYGGEHSQITIGLPNMQMLWFCLSGCSD